jgi:hypothetical protein
MRGAPISDLRSGSSETNNQPATAGPAPRVSLASRVSRLASRNGASRLACFALCAGAPGGWQLTALLAAAAAAAGCRLPAAAGTADCRLLAAGAGAGGWRG